MPMKIIAFQIEKPGVNRYTMKHGVYMHNKKLQPDLAPIEAYSTDFRVHQMLNILYAYNLSVRQEISLLLSKKPRSPEMVLRADRLVDPLQANKPKLYTT